MEKRLGKGTQKPKLSYNDYNNECLVKTNLYNHGIRGIIFKGFEG